MAGKRLDVIDYECQVRQIGSYLNRPAFIILADLDELLAFWRFEENQLRTASAGVRLTSCRPSTSL